MITFHVSRQEYTELRNTGALTIVRGADKSWTERFNTELGATFSSAQKTAAQIEPDNAVCQVKLQNLNEVILADLKSVSMGKDHLDKWKYNITLAYKDEKQPETAPEETQSKSEPAPCPVPAAQEIKIGVDNKLMYALIAVATILAVLIGVTLLH